MSTLSSAPSASVTALSTTGTGTSQPSASSAGSGQVTVRVPLEFLTTVGPDDAGFCALSATAVVSSEVTVIVTSPLGLRASAT